MRVIDERISSARLYLAHHVPYLQTGILKLLWREVPGLGTFAVSPRMVVSYDPAVLNVWKTPQVAGAIVHELFHVKRHHAPRREAIAADPELWNAAADLEINDDIRAARLELPDGVLYPETFKFDEGLLAEEYYALLRQMADEAKKRIGGGSFGGGKCGSGAGKPEPGEDLASGKPEVEGRSEAEVAQAMRDMARDIKAHNDRKPGTVPAGWVRWADEQLEPPKVTWQQKLANAARSALEFKRGMVDYTYRAPSRRQGALGYGAGRPILPTLQAPVPRVVCAVDTSGSMGKRELTAGLAEINGVFRALGAPIQFIACDAAVHANRKVRSWQEVAAELKGGGGTDFCPVFDALEGQLYDVLVFVTDGYGPAPDKAPDGIKVIWLVVGGSKAPADWGEEILLDEDFS